ncbi:MAG: 30S ribosome-binding factor RbfA [Magnetococcales bacterium]|nr:30S ribosome-binding factor RbfA [Magnetococcales bacterium]MBF0438963.1 30S ribosome-binding factor RbfA [Magnetococcales bacterium]
MSVRVERVRGQIRKELAALLQNGEVHDPRVSLSMISITDVTLSRDLQHAVIFFTAMGQELAKVQEGLNRASGFMRARVGRNLRLRLAPELRFQPDFSLSRADHIEQLLRTVHIPPVTEEGRVPEELSFDR